MEAVQESHSVVVDVNHGSGGCDDGEKELAGGGGPRRSCGSSPGNRLDGGGAVAAAAAEEIVKERRSSVSECSVEVDLERGIVETVVHLSKSERDCRICHMGLDAGNQESGLPIELGCSCKDDLAAAHRQCAETWFKIKGNKICEVCGSIALNVAGAIEAESVERWNEANNAAHQASGAAAPPHVAEARNFWQGHRFLNFLLACMVFAFVISWLFHFNVPS